jgi:hypothetical protein
MWWKVICKIYALDWLIMIFLYDLLLFSTSCLCLLVTYSLRPMKSVILVFLGQISGGAKRL